MFCIECGEKIEENSNFCNKCGSRSDTLIKKHKKTNLDGKWWIRLAKVIYVGLFLPAVGIVILVWSENAPYYSSYSNTYRGSYGEAFFYSLLALVICIIVLKLIKISFLYVASGKTPDWKKELKRPY